MIFFELVWAVLLEVALLAFVGGLRQMWFVLRVGGAVPQSALRERLAKTGASRMRSTAGVLLLATLLWTPLAIVAGEGLFALDLERVFGPAWVASNLAF